MQGTQPRPYESWEACGCLGPRFGEPYCPCVMASIDTPKFQIDWGEDNWRSFVPKSVEDLWSTFSIDQKVALYEWARSVADAPKL